MPSSLAPEDESALIAQAALVRKASVELAREDFNEFAERVMKDESTGEPVLQQWFHEDWTKKREQYNKALFISAVNMGKSQQFSVAYPVWLLGRNPRLRIAIVSKTQLIATQLTDACAKLIEGSPDVAEIFPNLRPGTIWNKLDRRVERRDRDGNESIKDPSIKPIGVDTSIMGLRFDLILLDDVIDGKSSRTEAQRDQSEQWITSTLFSRLDIESVGGDLPPPRVYFVGNAWHPDDVYERFRKRGWPTFRYPAVVNEKLAKQCPQVVRPRDEGGVGLSLGETVWASRLSQKALDELKRNELPAEWQRARMCEARDDEDARFKSEWIAGALRRGRSMPLCRTLRDFLVWDDPGLVDEVLEDDYMGLGEYTNPDANFWIVSGVDLSTGESTDLTAIPTIAICRYTYKRFLLSLEAGRWKAPEIIHRMQSIYSRFGGMFIVENNGTQAYIKQMLGTKTAIPVIPYTTGWTKADPTKGIEQMAQELYQGKWVFPSVNSQGADPEIVELCSELSAYDPRPRTHTGDRAMALWFAQILAQRLERQHTRNKARDAAWS